jgi:hypothetical protein
MAKNMKNPHQARKTPMSLPSQSAQKMKPLMIALACIAFAIFIIVEAPGFVRMMSSIGN